MFKVHLDQFEGPLDLLLYFIRRDELDIYDISISHITAEYITTLEEMKRLNVAVAGEFIDMAATLMRIKVRMMLPRPGPETEDAMIDPRQELIHQLLEYQRFKEAAEAFENLSQERAHHFTRTQLMSVSQEGDDLGVYLKEVTLFDLALYFKNVLERMPVIQSYELQREPVHLEDQKVFIIKSLDGDGRASFATLVATLKTKMEVVVTFLAILDLIREGRIRVIQSALFEDLEIQATVAGA